MTDFRGNTRVPKNFQRNNPGNIRPSENKWVGEVGKANGFIIFESMEYGIRALMHSIITNLIERKKTLREWIHSYAPEADKNLPNAYTSFVAAKTGYNPDRIITTLTPEGIKKIADAMALQENSKGLDKQWLDDAWRLVSNHRKSLIDSMDTQGVTEQKKTNWALPLMFLGAGLIFFKHSKKKR